MSIILGKGSDSTVLYDTSTTRWKYSTGHITVSSLTCNTRIEKYQKRALESKF